MKNIKLKELLREGTWALPKNSKEIDKAKMFIKELEKFKDKIYNILGDDILFDHLDNAAKRMQELIVEAPKGKNWKEK